MRKITLPIVDGLQAYDVKNAPEAFVAHDATGPTGYSYVDPATRTDAGPLPTNLIIWGDNKKEFMWTQRPAMKQVITDSDEAGYVLTGNSIGRGSYATINTFHWVRGGRHYVQEIAGPSNMPLGTPGTPDYQADLPTTTASDAQEKVYMVSVARTGGTAGQRSVAIADTFNSELIEVFYNGVSNTTTDRTSDLPSALTSAGFAKGIVWLNNKCYLADVNGVIYNSDSGDISTWNALDFITAERRYDGLIAIDTHHDHIVAFGERGIEFFYDNANTTGSPLRRRQDIYFEVGLVGEPTKVEDVIYFVGQSEGTDLSLYKLENFQITKISDERSNYKIHAMASGADPLYLTGFVLLDRHMIAITQLSRSDDASNVTTYTHIENIFYDVKYQTIYKWSSANEEMDCKIIDAAIGGIFINFAGYLVSFRPIEHNVAKDSDNIGTDTDNIPSSSAHDITFTMISPCYSLGSSRRKFWKSVEIEGTYGKQQNTSDSVDMTISWSDDFYESFTSGRTISLKRYRWIIKGCGSAQSRTFKITGAPSARVFLKNWVFEYSEGAH